MKFLKFIRQFLCFHTFELPDLEETGIPQPEKPGKNARFSDHVDYFARLSSHPANSQRVRWPCAKCGKVFFGHCGLDISSAHGPIVKTDSAIYKSNDKLKEPAAS